MAKTEEKVRYETVIRVVQGDTNAFVRTSNRKLKNRLHKYGLDPDDESGTTEVYEEVPVGWLRVQKPREFTEDEIEATRERLAKALGRDKKGKAKSKAKAKPATKAKVSVEDDEEEDELTPRRAAKAKAKPAKAKPAKGKAAVEEDDELDDDVFDDEDEEEEEEEEPVQVLKRKAKRTSL